MTYRSGIREDLVRRRIATRISPKTVGDDYTCFPECQKKSNPISIFALLLQRELCFAMSVSKPTANSMIRRQGHNWIIGLICLVLFGLVGSFFVLTSSSISGEEFCPQLFQKREFSYQRVPGTKICISKTQLSPSVSPCSKNILTHLSAGNQTDWHVSSVQYGQVSQTLGPKILLSYLQSTNADGASVWDEWSFKNPPYAAILWPIVQEAAVQQMYFCIPEILGSIDTELNTKDFKNKLRGVCTQAALTKLKAMVESEARNSLRKWALSLTEEFSEDPEIQALR